MGAKGRSADSLYTRLVGRDREQRLLGDLLGQAVEGRGRLVLISGEAGIGKTALVEATGELAASRGALVLSGGCYDLTTTPPYGPWRELARNVRTRTGAPPGFPPLPEVLAIEQSPDPRRNQVALYEQVAGFAAELSRQRPLLIVLEDMHWADTESLDLLRALARRIGTMPVLLLVTHRVADAGGPAAIDSLVPLLVRESRARRLRLGPLDRAALDALITRLYPMARDEQARLADYLERHSQGNPFIAHELLRNLEDERRLEASNQGWRLADLEEVGVPPLLQVMIANRLDHLPDPVREWLLIGAVIGQEVALDVWKDVIGLNEGNMLEMVDALVSAQLVTAMPDGATMRFSHAFVHEALYQMVLPPRRRTLHRTIAEALAARAGSDPERVAWHYEQAGDERAAEWLIRAGERAQRAYAWISAAERLTAADELLAGSDDFRLRGWLKYRIGRLRRHADPAGALRWLGTAERLGVVGGDSALVAFSRFDQGHLRVLGGDYSQGIGQMIEGDAMLDALPHDAFTDNVAAWIADALPRDTPAILQDCTSDPGTAAETRRGTLVQWMVEAGRLEEARKLGEAFVSRLAGRSALDDQRMSSLGDAWFGLGRVHAQLGAVDRARDAMRRALDCYSRIEHHLLMASTLRVELAEVLILYLTANIDERERIARRAEDAYRRASGAADEALTLGFASLEQMLLEGRWPDASDLLETMAEQSGGIAVWRHRVLALLARLEREQGRPERAWNRIAEVLPAGPDTEPGGTTYVRAIELQLLAVQLTLDAGDLPAAGRWLDALNRWLSWSGAVRGRAELMLARAAYVAASGNTEDALALASSAIELAEERRQPLVLLAGHRLIGGLETAQGHADDAELHLKQALNLAEACLDPFEAALTKLALAEARAVSGAEAEARVLLDEARDVFGRLGASRSLEQAERFAAPLQEMVTETDAPFGLSAREIEVLRLVAAGMTDAQVAEELFISYRTVTTHLTSIFNKLGVNSRVSATRIAVERGIV